MPGWKKIVTIAPQADMEPKKWPQKEKTRLEKEDPAGKVVTLLTKKWSSIKKAANSGVELQIFSQNDTGKFKVLMAAPHEAEESLKKAVKLLSDKIKVIVVRADGSEGDTGSSTWAAVLNSLRVALPPKALTDYEEPA
jgi:hypothetical protein